VAATYGIWPHNSAPSQSSWEAERLRQQYGDQLGMLFKVWVERCCNFKRTENTAVMGGPRYEEEHDSVLGSSLRAEIGFGTKQFIGALSNVLNGENGIAPNRVIAGGEFDYTRINEIELQALIHQFAGFVIGQQAVAENIGALSISSLVDDESYAKMLKNARILISEQRRSKDLTRKGAALAHRALRAQETLRKAKRVK
jgi:hypothetical protein